MEISDVGIKLASDDGPLQAFCCVEFDGEFVVRDLKIIRGQKGIFIAMPSRKLMAKCHDCSAKNDLGSRYCNRCGVRLTVDNRTAGKRPRLFADIAHPISPTCRSRIQEAVLSAFEQEQLLARQPGYICRFDEFEKRVA